MGDTSNPVIRHSGRTFALIGNLFVSVYDLRMRRWRFIRGSWILLRTMSDRFACCEMKSPTWAQRRPCCRRGAHLTKYWTRTPPHSTLSVWSFVFISRRLVRSRSPSPLPRLSRSSSPLRSESPTRAQLTHSSRHARLMSRFSDLYAVERLEAQKLLRHYIDDFEMVHKTIFVAVVVWLLLNVDGVCFWFTGAGNYSFLNVCYAFVVFSSARNPLRQQSWPTASSSCVWERPCQHLILDQKV